MVIETILSIFKDKIVSSEKDMLGVYLFGSVCFGDCSSLCIKNGFLAYAAGNQELQ